MSAGSPSPLAFIDTNIWLYALSESQDKQKTQRARSLIRQTAQIAISTQVINEVSVNLLRKFQADEQDIRKLASSFYRKYLVVEFNLSTFVRASDLRVTYQLSYWDSLIAASALDVGATILYSEDMHDGLTIHSQLTVVNPMRTPSQP